MIHLPPQTKLYLPRSGLAGWWPCRIGSSTTVKDHGPYGNHGTLAGGATWALDEGLYTIDYDGTDGKLTIPDSNSLDIGSTGTIMAWVKIPSSPVAFGQVIGKRETGVASGFSYLIDMGAGGNVIRGLLSDGVDLDIITGGSTLSTDTWTHVAMTWDSSNLRVYFNGVSDATPVSQTVTPFTNTFALGIGWGDNPTPLYSDMRIDNSAVYNRALSAAEIASVVRYGRLP